MRTHAAVSGVPSELHAASAAPAATHPLLALQQSIGNRATMAAIARLTRAPSPVLQRDAKGLTAKEQDEFLSLVLHAAASRAYDDYELLKAVDLKDAKKRFRTSKEVLGKDLDAALALSEKQAAGKGAFKAADSLFGAAIPLVQMAKKERWSGHDALETKLSALNKSLQKHGYRFPVDKIASGKVDEPQALSGKDVLREVHLGLTAARGEMDAGLKQLRAERKAGKDPKDLYGAREARSYAAEAVRHLEGLGALTADDKRALADELKGLDAVALELLREGGKLAGAGPMWAELNRLNRLAGLDPLMPFGTPTALSREEAAVERLELLNKKRIEMAEAGKPWTSEDTKAQVGAEHEAMDVANQALARAMGAAGDHVDTADVMQRIELDIGRIELARSLGYTDAVTFLASQALDTPSNVESFVRSLIGNLVWALSSFIPAFGIFKAGSRFAKVAFKGEVGKADTALAAAIGTFGAMFAQFSAGLPSSGKDVSAQLDTLKKSLKDSNAQFCDMRRAQAYIALSHLIAEEPPKPTDDRADYLASLETALRHLIFGEIFERKLNDGPRPQEAKVEEEAKRQLLAAASAPFADVDDKGKLEESTPVLDLDYAKKILKAGEQSSSLRFDQFDLAARRIPIAAREMGCEVSIDEAEVNQKLAKGQQVEIPVTSWSWKRAGLNRRTGDTGSFTRWHELHRDKRVWTSPDFTLARELDSESIADVKSITVMPTSLSRKSFHGKEIYVLDRVMFDAVGGEHFSGMFRGSKPPETFTMVYSFKES